MPWIERPHTDIRGGHKSTKLDWLNPRITVYGGGLGVEVQLKGWDTKDLPMPEPVDPALKPRILVVDDEPDLLDEIQESLLAAGWEAAGVSNAADACEAIEIDKDITVVLSDVRMPGMDGLGLAKWICENRDDATATEVVLLTGHGTMDDAAKAVRIGAFDFLAKPVGLRALLDATERAHASASAKRQKEAARTAHLNDLNADRDRLVSGMAATEAVLLTITERANVPAEELLPTEDAQAAEPSRPHADRARPRSHIEQLETIDTSKGVPLAVTHRVSHELRPPLADLMVIPELMSTNLVLGLPEVMGKLATVRAAGIRLTAIADDFAELLVPAALSDLQFREVAPALVLDLARCLVRTAAAEADRRVEVGLTPDQLIETDPAALAAALGRLLRYVLASGMPGQCIILSAHLYQPDEITFEISTRDPACPEAEAAPESGRPSEATEGVSWAGYDNGLGFALAGRAAGLLGGRLQLGSGPSRSACAAIVVPRRRLAPMPGGESAAEPD